MLAFNVFDTETVNGKAFLIANKDEVRDISSLQDIIDFLLSTPENVRFCWNLDYDAGAILKYINAGELDRLYLNGTVRVGKVTITYIQSKVLRISTCKRTVECFDLLQFFNMSLDAAGEKFLSVRKKPIPKKVKTDMGTYYPKPEWHERIRRYCHHDALMTYRMGELFLSMLEKAGVSARKFYSTGYLAGKFLKRVTYGIIPDEVTMFVERNYYGGRNECTKRGMISSAYIYDINSAYPSVIRELKNLDGAIYSWSDAPDKEADYFFMETTLTLKDGLYMYPIPQKMKGHGFIYYPRMVKRKVVINNFEWDMMNRLKIIDHADIGKVLNIYCKKKDRPFSFVDELFAERKKSDAHNYIFKLILNSLYGKTLERKRMYRKLSDREIHSLEKRMAFQLEFKRYQDGAVKRCPHAWEYYKKECDCSVCHTLRLLSREKSFHVKRAPFEPVEVWNNGTLEYFRSFKKPGKRFNVIYGTLITSFIRCSIYEASFALGTDFIACFTDSIFTLSPIPDHYVSNALGKFSLKAKAENLLMVGSGIYEYDSLGKSYTRFRGFTHYKGLRKRFKTRKDKLSLDNLMRISWGVIVNQTNVWNPDDYNRLIKNRKTLNINFDHKRIWERDYKHAKDALSTLIESKPHVLTSK